MCSFVVILNSQTNQSLVELKDLLIVQWYENPRQWFDGSLRKFLMLISTPLMKDNITITNSILHLFVITQKASLSNTLHGDLDAELPYLYVM